MGNRLIHQTKPLHPWLYLVLLFISGVFNAACSGGSETHFIDEPPPKPTIIQSVVEKGPFVLGSSVDLAFLYSDSTPTGDVYLTQTRDFLGTFRVTVPLAEKPQLVQARSGGYYYNEATGKLSSADITLRALAEVNVSSPSLNINLLTHLSALRTLTLIESGQSYNEAANTAQGELREALGLGAALPPSWNSGTRFSILDGNDVESAYLLLVSSAVAYASQGKDGQLQALLNQIEGQLSSQNGSIDATLTKQLKNAEKTMHPYQVEGQFKEYLTVLGSDAQVPRLALVMDTDGDGVPNARDNCPYDANPDQKAVCEATIRKVLVANGPPPARACALLDSGLYCRDRDVLEETAKSFQALTLNEFLAKSSASLKGDFLDAVWYNDGHCVIKRNAATTGRVMCYDSALTQLTSEPFDAALSLSSSKSDVCALSVTGNDTRRVSCLNATGTSSQTLDFPLPNETALPTSVQIFHQGTAPRVCVLMSDQRILCQNGSTFSEPKPKAKFSAFDVDDRYGCGVLVDNKNLSCWPLASKPPSPPSGTYSSVTVDGMACATRADGAGAVCWDKPAIGFYPPTDVALQQIAVDSRFGGCALHPNGNKHSILCF